MLNATLAKLLILSIITGLVHVNFAMGSIERPRNLATMGPKKDSESPGKIAQAKIAERKISRQPSSFYARIKQSILAKFRPVERDEDHIDFNEAGKALKSTTTMEKIFDDDFEKKMRNEYASRVQPFEATATNPIWRARHWERQRYEQGRNKLAEWTAREVLDDQLTDFFNGGDKDSAPMKILSTARELSGGGDDKEEPKLTKEEKAARAHRRDLPVVAEDESIPTKLRTKINVLKQHGSVVFSNPIAVTSLNGSRDEVSVNMNKEFRKLTLRSNLSFAMKREVLNLNVNKKITDEVSVDFDHFTYTGRAVTDKTVEQARVNYSIAF